MSAYALTNDYADGAAHFVRPRSREFQDVPGRSNWFFLQDFRAKWSSPEPGMEYPWTMSRTLFDVDDAPDARKNARTSSRPCRDAIVPVRLTEG